MLIGHDHVTNAGLFYNSVQGIDYCGPKGKSNNDNRTTMAMLELFIIYSTLAIQVCRPEAEYVAIIYSMGSNNCLI